MAMKKQKYTIAFGSAPIRITTEYNKTDALKAVSKMIRDGITSIQIKIEPDVKTEDLNCSSGK